MARDLNEREKDILELIIQKFILTASPVGSRFLSKRSDLGLSDATIRNVMSDLEDEGYITHPHTSAGRIPTDKGYKFYVSSMMRVGALPQSERLRIDQNFDLSNPFQSGDIMRESSKILGKLSNQIGIVLSPKLSKGIFEKLEIVAISSVKVMVIIAVRSGLVKTIMLEVRSEISRQKLDSLAAFLNERLAGLSLEEIHLSFAARVSDGIDETGLVRVFIDQAEKLFEDQPVDGRLHFAGTENILAQPEFEQPEKIRGVIEMIQNEDIIVHLLEESQQLAGSGFAPIEGVRVIIGKENRISRIKDCSIITAQYSVGETEGTVGVIGPTRMDYAKIVRVIDYIAKRLSAALNPAP
ncbi:MAG: heat-inducible transcription repressor HrcA [Rhizobacter sp.]|nr:heat-inducible transcription repressor HrcA [Chlorobiales bacterium]